MCMSSVRFFYYSEKGKLEEKLKTLFDNTLEDIFEALRASQQRSSSSSRIVLRIHHYVERRIAFATEIAVAQGQPAPRELEEHEIYAQLLEAYETMSKEAKSLRSLIITVLQNGQHFPSKSELWLSVASGLCVGFSITSDSHTCSYISLKGLQRRTATP